MAQNHQAVIKEFFTAYENRFNNALGENPKDDIEGTMAAFAECFVESSPLGVHCGQNNDEFRAVIPQGNARYRSIGTKSMKIDGLDITSLDDFHAMTKVHWNSRYVRKDGKEVTIKFDVIYLLNFKDDKPRIFAYITGDEAKTLKENGIMPE
jgi:hypothetical protein